MSFPSLVGIQYAEYKQLLTNMGHLRTDTRDAQNSERRTNCQGDRFDNLTDWCAEQAAWTVDNWPEIMYALDRPASWLLEGDLKPPPLKTYTIYGQYLRDIPILPDHISSQVEGWRMELYCRMDPRVKNDDLIDRMPLDKRPEKLARGNYKNTTYQMTRDRFRERANLLGWVSRGRHFDVQKASLVKKLSDRGLDPNANTTRGLSWGLARPENGPYSARIPPEGSQKEIKSSVAPIPSDPGILQAAIAQWYGLLATIGGVLPAPPIVPRAQPAPPSLGRKFADNQPIPTYPGDDESQDAQAREPEPLERPKVLSVDQSKIPFLERLDPALSATFYSPTATRTAPGGAAIVGVQGENTSLQGGIRGVSGSKRKRSVGDDGLRAAQEAGAKAREEAAEHARKRIIRKVTGKGWQRCLPGEWERAILMHSKII